MKSTKKIIYILKTILEQNYFQLKQKYYQKSDGLAMGPLTSALVGKAYIKKQGAATTKTRYFQNVEKFAIKWKQA
jgi:hypothetical protein